MENVNQQFLHLKAGKYVVAVSGGVDSMVLLHMAQNYPHLHLVVAHYDHAIREESQQDRKFVEKYAMSHNLEFEYAVNTQVTSLDEASLRHVRYSFLRRICKNYNAEAILMAHHLDDVLETAIINLIRGTGRKGLTALRSHKSLVRPLLEVSKHDIAAYAKQHGLTWREDSSNTNLEYQRNYVRHKIVANFSAAEREKLYSIIVRQQLLNQQITHELQKQLQASAQKESSLPRYLLVMAPVSVAYELLQHYVKVVTGNTLERALAEKALLFAKTASPDKKFEMSKNWLLQVKGREVIVSRRLGVVS